MELSLSEDQVRFRDEVRNFVDAEVIRHAVEADRTGTFPRETLNKMAARGYLGIPLPKEYGGLGKDSISYLLAIEEISRGCGSTGVITAVHTSVGTYPIYMFGTDEQKDKFVKPLAKGEKIGAFALTEPEAGSDAAAVATTAVPSSSKSGYILNGSKIFISNGAAAEIMIVLAVTDKSDRKKGMSAFIVEKGTTGFEVGGEEHKMGLHASEASELIFDNCEVPNDNLLGELGAGFKIGMVSLDGGRLGIAAQALGVAQAAFDECLKFSSSTLRSGKPLNRYQGIQFMFSDIATQLEAARLLMYRAAYMKDNGQKYTKEASMAKVYATDVAMNAVNKLSNVMGEYGFTKRSPMERYLRDVKVTEIYEGTSEIQRLIIAKQLLKKS
jgi:alkylation response protein AidB-like acyl-CoA dehydrogenase